MALRTLHDWHRAALTQGQHTGHAHLLVSDLLRVKLSLIISN